MTLSSTHVEEQAEIVPVGIIDRVLDLNYALFVSRMAQNFSIWLKVDLTMQQFRVLLVLFAYGSLTSGALSEVLQVKISSVTSIIERLVKGGFVERLSDPKDRRVVRLQLSEEGRALVEELHCQAQSTMRAQLKRLTTEELEHLADGLGAWLGVENGVIPPLV